MGQFYDDYEDGKYAGKDKEAYSLIIKELLQNNSVGENKQRTLTGYNMESDTMIQFVPSMFYVFMYNNPEKDDPSFYDRVPMILCTGFSGGTVTGINFNYLPNNIRALFIDTILEAYSEFYSEENLHGGGLKINEKFAAGLLGGGLSSIVKIFKNVAGVDIGNAVRTYKTKNVIKSRMLEYDMWDAIPNLSFKDAVRGINLARAQIDTITPKE